MAEEKRELKPRLAITASFLEDYCDFSRDLKEKLGEFIEKFIESPLAPGINYESLQGSKDEKLRSVRIDLAHRGIIIAPRKGDVYLLVHVDREEEAYAWAINRVFERDDEAREILITKETFEETISATSEKDEGLLKALTDDELVQIKVPRILIPAVRAIENPEDFTKLETYLPDDSICGLIRLANGDSIHNVKKDMEEYG